MDINILERATVRAKVARFMLAYPNEGEAGAVERCARFYNLTEDSVREIVAFVEEPTS